MKRSSRKSFLVTSGVFIALKYVDWIRNIYIIHIIHQQAEMEDCKDKKSSGHFHSFYILCPNAPFKKENIFIIEDSYSVDPPSLYYISFQIQIFSRILMYLSTKYLENIFIYCNILQFIKPISTGYPYLFGNDG